MLAPDRDDSRTTIAVGSGAGLFVVGGTAVAATQTSAFGPVLAFGAAVLAFVGAVLGAWIAASSAARRQKAELKAAEERHAATLAAESERLREQLRHDRAIAEMQQLRELFDEAAAKFESALRHLVEMGARYRRTAPDPDQYSQAIERAVDLTLPLAEMGRRLELRFDRDDEIVTAFKAATSSLGALVTKLPSSIDEDGFSVETKGDVERARDRFGTFCGAVRDRLADQARTK